MVNCWTVCLCQNFRRRDFLTIFGPVVTVTISSQNEVSSSLSLTAPQVACMISCSQTFSIWPCMVMAMVMVNVNLYSTIVTKSLMHTRTARKQWMSSAANHRQRHKKLQNAGYFKPWNATLCTVQYLQKLVLPNCSKSAIYEKFKYKWYNW